VNAAALNKLGAAHRARIERAAAERPAAIVGADEPAEAVHDAAAAVGASGVVFIHGAEQPRFDAPKASLVELGHMGACADAPDPGAHLWWGSASGWAGRSGGRGDLPVIVSYYTEATPYEDEARELVRTCDALGLEHRVVGVPARGAWEKNCAMKAGFVLEMWEALDRPVLWVDADARMRRIPELLRGPSADLGVHKAAGWQFASGTVFINATELGGELLRIWKRRCEADPLTWDQVHLDESWAELSSRAPLETLWFPQAYTKIFDRPVVADGGGDAVIEHFQASRRLKAAVTTSGQPRAFRDFDEATKAARRASRPVCAAGAEAAA
jgi:hypothetical protein